MQLTVEVDEHGLEMQLTSVLTNLYTFGLDAYVHASLHAFRTKIIDRVLREHLVPMALQAVREEMKKKAQEYVTDTCCEAVWVEATTPPLQLKAIDDEVCRLTLLVHGQRFPEHGDGCFGCLSVQDPVSCSF